MLPLLTWQGEIEVLFVADALFRDHLQTTAQNEQANNKANGKPSTVYFWSFQTESIVFLFYSVLFYTWSTHLTAIYFSYTHGWIRLIYKRYASNCLLRCDNGSHKHATTRWVTRQVIRLIHDNTEYFTTHSYDMLQLTLISETSFDKNYSENNKFWKRVIRIYVKEFGRKETPRKKRSIRPTCLPLQNSQVLQGNTAYFCFLKSFCRL
jgi:hypothetical protein